MISPLFSCYLGSWTFNQGYLNSSDPPTACWLKKKKSAQKAVESTLVSKQNTTAPEKKKKKKISDYPVYTPSPPPMLGWTFLRLIKHVFLSFWRGFFLLKVLFHAANTICGAAAIVLRNNAASLTGYVSSTATSKQTYKQTTTTKLETPGTETGVQNRSAPPPMFACDVIHVATSVWWSLLATCSILSTQRTKRSV